MHPVPHSFRCSNNNNSSLWSQSQQLRSTMKKSFCSMVLRSRIYHLATRLLGWWPEKSMCGDASKGGFVYYCLETKTSLHPRMGAGNVLLLLFLLEGCNN